LRGIGKNNRDHLILGISGFADVDAEDSVANAVNHARLDHDVVNPISKEVQTKR
jgi:hypothetical protein